MLYYLSLLTHTDQLAFFRLFGYLTFRSGAAVMTSGPLWPLACVPAAASLAIAAGTAVIVRSRRKAAR